MIKTEQEYKRTKKMVEEERSAIEKQKKNLKDKGFSDEEVHNLLAPGIAIHEQKAGEVLQYERIKKGDFNGVEYSLGKMLIAIRIYRGMSQAELARRLKVSPAQVSMDERNEYYGISVQRNKDAFPTLTIT
ncbi:helix-turn-helix domain-containing protein [Desmospora profundinema]|uniref:Ribosome-binding protein aMBF1 (Putative translation factor) n=1 Tax=Desmospora profundinema TaxID=1571184 RepID=A0ABU1ILQ5_9BACL|nr:helix-turn-helix transcriptional regulator [Desmospora profundinema]MDR6225668.1 ribosome-binding protein aMBF1 (putative translation factor) [Desmospora profundinema]